MKISQCETCLYCHHVVVMRILSFVWFFSIVKRCISSLHSSLRYVLCCDCVASVQSCMLLFCDRQFNCVCVKVSKKNDYVSKYDSVTSQAQQCSHRKQCRLHIAVVVDIAHTADGDRRCQCCTSWPRNCETRLNSKVCHHCTVPEWYCLFAVIDCESIVSALGESRVINAVCWSNFYALIPPRALWVRVVCGFISLLACVLVSIIFHKRLGGSFTKCTD